MYTANTTRIWLLTLAALLLFIGNAQASASIPEVMLDSISKEVIAKLKSEREHVREKPEHLFDVVENVLIPHVDMLNMSRWVLGKHWRDASPAQQERFVAEFKTLLVRFYVAALLDDPNELDNLIAANEEKPLITFMASNTPDDAKQAMVRSSVNVPNGPAIPVTFRMYRAKPGDEWKVIDVTVDGISLVTNYRSTFDSEINKDGLQATIDSLAARNQELLEKARNGNIASEKTTQ